MARRAKGFYAYPSKPEHLPETIRNAVGRINRSNQVRVRTWEKLAVGGRIIVDRITEEIDHSDVCACDLSYPNCNVLFELGYATGRQKRVWPTLNSTVAGAHTTYRDVYSALVPVGYTSYANHNELADAFLRLKPWSADNEPMLSRRFMAERQVSEVPSTFYVALPFPSDISNELTKTLSASVLGPGLLIDQPRDNPSASITWYAEKVRDADAVVVHLVSDDEKDPLQHNANCALIAGLAQGMGRHLLILVREPHLSPLDYHTLLKRVKTANQCREETAKWLAETEEKLPRRRQLRSSVESRRRGGLELANLSLGEWVAEYEYRSLEGYFVETTAYRQAQNASNSIFVGRRGSGKTANFYGLASSFAGNNHAHVCLIKPLGYDVDGVARLLEQNIHRAERGYLVESLWKYLLYTELAGSYRAAIRDRPAHYATTDAEKRFMEYVDSRPQLVGPPFSARLESSVEPLLDLAALPSASEQQAKISEHLHEHFIRELREHLGHVLHNRDKVVLLIDNLEEPWEPTAHVDALASLLLGLMRVTRDVVHDFSVGTGHGHWRESVPLSIITFLRSDIFHHLAALAAEQDKLPIRRLVWEPRETILRVLNERMVDSFDGRFEADQLWAQLFPALVHDQPTQNFILDTILPRPRDAIFLVVSAGMQVGRGPG